MVTSNSNFKSHLPFSYLSSTSNPREMHSRLHSCSYMSRSSLDKFVHSKAGACRLEMLDRIQNNNIQRHRIESEGRPSEYWIRPCLYLMIFKCPGSKGGGAGRKQDYFFYHDTKNKVITILMPQTPSNHTRGQDILWVATPQISCQ